MRVAVAAGPGRTALLQELAEDGGGYAAPALVNDFPAAVAEYERARPGGEHVRWVWADTSVIYPSLLHGGVRVDRCHDAALIEALLRAREGTGLSATVSPSQVRPARVCPARVCPPRARRAGHPPPGKPPCSARPSPESPRRVRSSGRWSVCTRTSCAGSPRIPTRPGSACWPRWSLRRPGRSRDERPRHAVAG